MLQISIKLSLVAGLDKDFKQSAEQSELTTPAAREHLSEVITHTQKV